MKTDEIYFLFTLPLGPYTSGGQICPHGRSVGLEPSYVLGLSTEFCIRMVAISQGGLDTVAEAMFTSMLLYKKLSKIDAKWDYF